MEFQTRSKEQVLVDLKEKLDGLPAGHPDVPPLSRMINDLRADLGQVTTGGHGRGLSFRLIALNRDAKRA
jgi:hypothetical protein